MLLIRRTKVINFDLVKTMIGFSDVKGVACLRFFFDTDDYSDFDYESIDERDDAMKKITVAYKHGNKTTRV
jgi:hypothetical protein